jgi:16S rRNA (uracil1498-N3)-methyltransferase
MDHFVYLPEATDPGLYTVSPEEHHHLRNVLRVKLGQRVFALNGRGTHFEGEIAQLDKKSASIQIDRIIASQARKGGTIHLAVAPTKNMDRFEFLVEKAVEIGVDRITPLLCERSERKNLRNDRLEKIIVSGMKQSRSFYKTRLDELTALPDLESETTVKMIAHCLDDQERKELNHMNLSSALLMIGPEGDFSPKEIQWALDNDFTPISLGEKRLRTETAAIFGLSIIQHIRHRNE